MTTTGGRPDVLASVPFAAHFGLRLTDVGDMTVVLDGSDRSIGDASRGSLHGGVLAALLETAAWVHLKATDTAADVETVDFTTVFLREAAVRDTFARASILRRGRRFAHVRVDAWQDDPARPVAAGQGTFALG